VHPEFSFLPRKFKIAVTGAERDRAAIQVHDIGLHLKKNDQGELGFAVYVGGGQGRTPMVAKKIRDFLPEQDLLSYTTAIMRVYNLNGRRDNKYKARIKILVHETGTEELTRQVEAEFEALKDTELKLPEADIRASRPISRRRAARPGRGLGQARRRKKSEPGFAAWLRRNVNDHWHPDYASVTISLKGIGEIPGDASDAQMDAIADLAEELAFDEIRVSHEQNLILPHVARADLRAVYDRLVEIGLATANAGLVTDIIACPGLDYCALANARSIPVAQEISRRLGDQAAAGGDRRSQAQDLRLHQCLRPSPCRPYRHSGRREEGRRTLPDHAGRFGRREHLDRRDRRPRLRARRDHGRVETVVDTYLGLREDASETFLDAYRRVGAAPFKEALYGSHAKAA
jgi:sulfite reductase (NADPH) hemoprotein beta-component